MATIFTHAIVAATLARAWPRVTPSRRLYGVAALAAIAPDLDVIGLRFGVAYGDPWGHRGITHSLLFALALALFAAALLARERNGFHVGRYANLVCLMTSVTASHGILDAFTNGGLGIAFFAPFHLGRHFLPFTPLEVSPIGAAFLSERGLAVLASETLWIWLPCVCIWLALRRTPRVE